MNKEKYWKPFISCVIKHGDELLALKRAKGGYFGDTYDFPGGKIEFNETIEEAVVREVFEESGIKIDKEKLQLRAAIDWIDEFETETRYAVCFCYLYEVDEKPKITISKREHSQYNWLHKDDDNFDEFIKDIIKRINI